MVTNVSYLTSPGASRPGNLAAVMLVLFGVSFGWQLQSVEGASDEDRLMAPAAVPYLLP